jgi:hypothetical protein
LGRLTLQVVLPGLFQVCVASVGRTEYIERPGKGEIGSEAVVLIQVHLREARLRIEVSVRAVSDVQALSGTDTRINPSGCALLLALKAKEGWSCSDVNRVASQVGENLY